ncbi:MAG: hypothetical protein Q8R79_04440 [Legionellaceae bacterium]|nr:hypothetical protein [Legionellaceae bacterium]
MKHKNSFILLSLALIFSLPPVAAYLFFIQKPWLHHAPIYQGTWISKAHTLNNLPEQAQWHLFYWQPNPCRSSCIQHLDTLARIRLALGRKLYSVQQYLAMTSENLAGQKKTQQSFLKMADIQTLILTSKNEKFLKQHMSGAAYGIATPQREILLLYPIDTPPKALYHDLHLLVSKTPDKRGLS